MQYKYPIWPRVVLPSGAGQTRATLDWVKGTALGEMASYQLPEVWESGECSCLDRGLAELEELLRALDAYTVEH